MTTLIGAAASDVQIFTGEADEEIEDLEETLRSRRPERKAARAGVEAEALTEVGDRAEAEAKR